jgi:hypothetical protein
MMPVFGERTPWIQEWIGDLLSGMSVAMDGHSQAHMDVLVAFPERRSPIHSNYQVFSLIKQENPAQRRGFRYYSEKISPEA